MMLSPVILRASTTIAPHQKLELNTPDLQNPFRNGMLLDEIRIRVSTDVAPWNSNTARDGLGFLTRARFHLGREPLTHGFVHTPLLGKRLNTQDPGARFNTPFVYTWRFPKPLYVPGTEFVIPTMFYDPTTAIAGGLTPPSELQVDVAYAGRVCKGGLPMPRNINVPWAAVYDTGALPVGTSDDEFIVESEEPQLVNTFNEPVQTQRFLGRQVGATSSFGGILSENLVNQGTFGRTLTRARMVDSNGRYAIKNRAAFGDVFFAGDNAWTVNTFLAPKGFYLVGLEADFRGPFVAPFDDITHVQTLVSMIGHREVAVNP